MDSLERKGEREELYIPSLLLLLFLFLFTPYLFLLRLDNYGEKRGGYPWFRSPSPIPSCSFALHIHYPFLILVELFWGESEIKLKLPSSRRKEQKEKKTNRKSFPFSPLSYLFLLRLNNGPYRKREEGYTWIRRSPLSIPTCSVYFFSSSLPSYLSP